MAYSWERLSASEKDSLLGGVFRGGPILPPQLVEISWQDRCNIDCFFCSTSELRAGNASISAERLERLFQEMSSLEVKAVRLMGGGEPLFRKDTEPLIRALGRHGLRIADVTTNGVLLTEPVVRALYDTGCDEITISLNAAGADSYASMMQTTPSNFGRVIENVRRAAEIKRVTGAVCKIRVQFLVYKDNYRQIPAMYRLFQTTGADSFFLNGLYPVRPMPGMDESEIEEMLRLYESVLEQDYFDTLEGFSFWERSIAERIDASSQRVFKRAPLTRRASIRFRQLLDPQTRARRRTSKFHEFCLAGWYGMTLNANGDAVTCCILQDHKSAILGNIHRQSLSEIWLGEDYRRFREELTEIMARRGDVSDFSGACHVEGLCAKKGACPSRSWYWQGDVHFRRAFHTAVEGLAAPPEGLPFASLEKTNRSRLPSVSGSALPIR